MGMTVSQDTSGRQSQADPERSAAVQEGPRGLTPVRFFALLFLLTFPALLYLRNFYISDADFGWHLRTGEWILEHHTVPRTDPFSSYGLGKPWIAYSWLFETGLALLYRAFGLSGIALLEVVTRTGIAVLLYRLARSLTSHFWLSVGVVAIALSAMLLNFAPRAGMFSAIFLILELQLFSSVVATGKWTRVWWLPALILLWANIHVQFIYGLFFLGLFASERILNRLVRYKSDEAAFPGWTLWVLGGSSVATLVNPYGWRLYSAIAVIMSQTRAYDLIKELQPIPFREPVHFAPLFLALVAAVVLGWRGKPRPLLVVTLLFASISAFRAMRDVWLLAIVCVWIICSCAVDQFHSRNDSRLPLRQRWATAICALAILVLAWRRYDVTNSWMEMGLAGKFPVGAVHYVEQHHLQGPLFNDFNNGGFLIWRLPSIPVSIDGRTNLHGMERTKEYQDALRGMPGWEKNPDLDRANLVIWPTRSPLPALLRFDPRFEQVFEDPQGVVFVRRGPTALRN